MTPQTFFIFIGLCVPFLLLTVWSVVNAAQKEFGSLKKKIIWIIIASIPFIGGLIYLAFGFRKGKKPELE